METTYYNQSENDLKNLMKRHLSSFANYEVTLDDNGNITITGRMFQETQAAKDIESKKEYIDRRILFYNDKQFPRSDYLLSEANRTYDYLLEAYKEYKDNVNEDTITVFNYYKDKILNLFNDMALLQSQYVRSPLGKVVVNTYWNKRVSELLPTIHDYKLSYKLETLMNDYNDDITRKNISRTSPQRDYDKELEKVVKML